MWHKKDVWRKAAAAGTVAAVAMVAAPLNATADQNAHVAVAAPAAMGGSARDYSWDNVADILAREGTTGDLVVHAHSGTYQGTQTYLAPELVAQDWNAMRWIGSGRFSRLSWQSGLSDLIAVTGTGNLVLATHTRGYPGPGTFNPPWVIGTGWNINDLMFTYDFTGDAYEDILARRAGTGDVYLYAFNSIDSTFAPPELVARGAQADDWLAMTDRTGDGVPDLMFLRDGTLGVFSFADESTTILATNWTFTDALVLADVDRKRGPDLITRDTRGVLRVHPDSGIWNPTPDGTAFDAYLPAANLGFGWDAYTWLT